MNLFAKCLRIACVVTATMAPAAGASAFVLGQPVTGAVVTPVPPLRLPPTLEVCLQRFQRRVNDCNAAYPCVWGSPQECFDNLNLCIEAAEQIYDNCVARSFPSTPFE